MKNKSAIIIGASGQYGIILANLLIKKKYKVLSTTRSTRKLNILKKKYPNLNFINFNIYNKNKIKKLLLKINPSIIFYFAGQSSPKLSFLKKRETLISNYQGCKNFLEVIHENKILTKFFNAASSEMYGHIKTKINHNTPKNPLNPYGRAKKKSFNLVREYRDNFGMKNYNGIMFNTESFLRNKDFVIPKICRGAINAYKKGKKLNLNNTVVSREWNWCEEQCELMLKFIKKKPQDFILSNGKSYSIKQMLRFSFQYFNLDYKNFVEVKFNNLNKNEVKTKRSNIQKYLNKNKIKYKPKIYGKTLIHKMIKFYLNERKI